MSERIRYGKFILSLTTDKVLARPTVKMLEGMFGYDFTTIETSDGISIYGPFEMQDERVCEKWAAFAWGVLRAWTTPVTKYL